MAADDHLSQAQFLDLYHHTTGENADLIIREGRMRGIKGEAHFSNVPHGYYGGDYGPVAVHMRVPANLVEREHGFNNSPEVFYKGRAADIQPEHILGKELAG
jgi:hypothetical protein